MTAISDVLQEGRFIDDDFLRSLFSRRCWVGEFCCCFFVEIAAYQTWFNGGAVLLLDSFKAYCGFVVYFFLRLNQRLTHRVDIVGISASSP